METVSIQHSTLTQHSDKRLRRGNLSYYHGKIQNIKVQHRRSRGQKLCYISLFLCQLWNIFEPFSGTKHLSTSRHQTGHILSARIFHSINFTPKLSFLWSVMLLPSGQGVEEERGNCFWYWKDMTLMYPSNQWICHLLCLLLNDTGSVFFSDQLES